MLRSVATQCAESYFKSAFELLEMRCVAGKLIKNNDDDLLKKYVNAISEMRDIPVEVMDLGVRVPGVAAVPRKGKPPCALYLDIRTLEVLEHMAAEYEGAASAAEIKNTTLKISVFRQAVIQLASTLKSAVGELKRTKAMRLKELEKSEAAKKRKPGVAAAPTKKGKTVTMMDIVAEKATPIYTFPFDQMATRAPEWMAQIEKGETSNIEPYIISAIPWVASFLQEASVVQKSFNEFKSDWAESSMRNSAGRGMRTNECSDGDATSANDFVLNKLADLHCKGSLLVSAITGASDAEKSVKSSIALSNFAIKKHSGHTSVEKGSLWCGRLSLHGCRQVALARVPALVAYMKSAGIAGLDVKAFFKELRDEGVKKMVDAGVQLWFATVAESEYIWLPAHFLVRETVMDNDCLGLRYGMVIPNDKVSMDEFKAVASSAATPQGHPSKGVLAIASAVESAK